MNRRKSRIRSKAAARDPIILPASERPRWRGLAKAVLICGAAGGLIGAAIGSALATTGYATTAALIGGIPPGVVGACALGWYGGLFGAMNRLRHGGLVGAGLGLLGAGTLGVVAGLSVWALPWSLTGSLLGALLQSYVTRPGRRTLGLVPGVAIGALVGILVRAFRADDEGVATVAFTGALIGAVVGVFLIPALLAWLAELPQLLRRWKTRR